MKSQPTFFFLLFLVSFAVFGHNEAENEFRRTAISNGIGLGTVIAVVASWERNKSVLWQLLAEFLAGFMLFIMCRQELGKRKKLTFQFKK